MGKFHVVYFGSNDVPVHLIKPILAEIDADMTIRRPTNDAEVVEMGRCRSDGFEGGFGPRHDYLQRRRLQFDRGF